MGTERGLWSGTTFIGMGAEEEKKRGTIFSLLHSVKGAGYSIALTLPLVP